MKTDKVILIAEVIREFPVSIRFKSIGGFSKRDLEVNFPVWSAVEIANIRGTLVNQFLDKQEEGVEEYLRLAYLSRLSNEVNSWQTALYRALYKSSWFHRIGFYINYPIKK